MRDERVEKLLRELDLDRYSDNFDEQEVAHHRYPERLRLYLCVTGDL